MSKGLLDDYSEEQKGNDPWAGDKRDFDPPKPIAPATYTFHVWRWGEFQGQDYVDMWARIDNFEPANGTEGNRDVQHRFWANDKWRIKEFLQNVLGDEFQQIVESQGGKIAIRVLAEQALGYPFIADVFHRNVSGYDYPFADIDLKSVSAYPQGEVIIPPPEGEDRTSFPFGGDT